MGSSAHRVAVRRLSSGVFAVMRAARSRVRASIVRLEAFFAALARHRKQAVEAHWVDDVQVCCVV